MAQLFISSQIIVNSKGFLTTVMLSALLLFSSGRSQAQYVLNAADAQYGGTFAECTRLYRFYAWTGGAGGADGYGGPERACCR